MQELVTGSIMPCLTYGWFSKLGSLCSTPKTARHPYKKDPKTDTNLENYPYIFKYILAPEQSSSERGGQFP